MGSFKCYVMEGVEGVHRVRLSVMKMYGPRCQISRKNLSGPYLHNSLSVTKYLKGPCSYVV